MGNETGFLFVRDCVSGGAVSVVLVEIKYEIHRSGPRREKPWIPCLLSGDITRSTPPKASIPSQTAGRIDLLDREGSQNRG